MDNLKTIRIASLAGRIGKIHAENLATRVPCLRDRIADPILDAARETASAAHPRGLRRLSPDHGRCCYRCSGDLFLNRYARQDDCGSRPRGKHIFCEKPIAYDLGKIDEALAAVEQAGVKLQMASTAVSIPTSARCARWCRTVRLGKCTSCASPAATRPTSHRVCEGVGGMFFDMTIHDFDMARYLSGDEVEEVYVAGGVRVDPRIGEAAISTRRRHPDLQGRRHRHH